LSTYGTATANGPSAPDQASGSTAQQAKDKAQETAQQAKGEAKTRVRDQVDQRSTQAGERVGGAAQDVRSVGEELRKQGKDQPAKLAEQVADRAESLGDYLKRSDGDTILRDVEDFGRQRPWAVVAGGIALGFAASRFLKASSSRRAQQSPPVRASLTAGAPTTRTGLAVGDVAPPSTRTGLATGDVAPPSTVPRTGLADDEFSRPPAPGAGGVSPVDGPTAPGLAPPARGL
jgi:broad specificity phosphatase PhoE